MGKPKKGAARKPLASKDPNVPNRSDAKEEGAASDLEERLRIVEMVNAAIDQEVASRSAAIRAMKEGHIASIKMQLQLHLAKYSAEIRCMPMQQFLTKYCPNTQAAPRGDGTLELSIMHDTAFTLLGLQPPGILQSAEKTHMHVNTPGCCAPQMSGKEELMKSISKQLSLKKREKGAVSWDEFLVAYRLDAGTTETASLATPSLRMRPRMIKNIVPSPLFTNFQNLEAEPEALVLLGFNCRAAHTQQVDACVKGFLKDIWETRTNCRYQNSKVFHQVEVRKTWCKGDWLKPAGSTELSVMNLQQWSTIDVEAAKRGKNSCRNAGVEGACRGLVTKDQTHSVKFEL